MRFGYTILYVREVALSVDFYERAFGLKRRFVHESGQYAELETGPTALAFAAYDLAAANLPGTFQPAEPGERVPTFEVCLVTEDVGTAYPITGPNPDGSFEAGTQIQAEFTQGAGSPEDPEKGPPAIRLDGTYPTWTINIDDGGVPGLPGEPDFNDIVLTAQATPVP